MSSPSFADLVCLRHSSRGSDGADYCNPAKITRLTGCRSAAAVFVMLLFAVSPLSHIYIHGLSPPYTRQLLSLVGILLIMRHTRIHPPHGLRSSALILLTISCPASASTVAQAAPHQYGRIRVIFWY